MDVEQLTTYLMSCGLAETRAAEVSKSKMAAPARTLFQANQLESKGLNDKAALLALQIAKDAGKLGATEQNYAVAAVVEGRLKSSDQVGAALKFLASNLMPVDDSKFDQACGVGASFSFLAFDEY